MKVFRHVLLIGNGAAPAAGTLQELARQADAVVAADGGADTARKSGLTPDVIIGDLDSVSPISRRQFPQAQWIQVADPNTTDLQKALDFLLAQKCRSCTLAGFTGGRLDFTLGNALALYPYAARLKLCLVGRGWKIYPVCKRQTFAVRPGARVSLLPLVLCSGVTLTGLKYPLRNARLPLGTTRTLSNEAARANFTVSLVRGTLLVYIED